MTGDVVPHVPTADERVLAAFVCEVATTCTDERCRNAAAVMLAMIVLAWNTPDVDLPA